MALFRREVRRGAFASCGWGIGELLAGAVRRNPHCARHGRAGPGQNWSPERGVASGTRRVEGDQRARARWPTFRGDQAAGACPWRSSSRGTPGTSVIRGARAAGWTQLPRPCSGLLEKANVSAPLRERPDGPGGPCPGDVRGPTLRSSSSGSRGWPLKELRQLADNLQARN